MRTSGLLGGAQPAPAPPVAAISVPQRHDVELALLDAMPLSAEWCYSQQPHDLQELCDLHGSDKGSRGDRPTPYPWRPHNYADLYAQLFDHCRAAVGLVFECGIGSADLSMPCNMGLKGRPGASLRVWRDYFPNAEVYGADIDDKILFEEDRIRTYHVDQTSSSSIEAMWQAIGRDGFDLMIDDGLHEVDGGIPLFERSIDRLAPGGVYIIEDVRPDQLPVYSAYFAAREYRASIVVLRREPREMAQNNLVIVRKPWSAQPRLGR